MKIEINDNNKITGSNIGKNNKIETNEKKENKIKKIVLEIIVGIIIGVVVGVILYKLKIN